MQWNQADSFGDIVDLAADAYGDKVALQDKRRQLTYRGFAQEIDRLGAALLSYGIQPGERVAILSQNRIEVAVLLGLCRFGFIPVPLNWRSSADDIALLLHDSEPSVLFVEDRYLQDLVPQLVGAAPDLTIVIGDSWIHDRHTYDDAAMQSGSTSSYRGAPSDPACIIYTSGTTSAPKGAVLTHASLVKNCRDCARDVIGFARDDLSLMIMPLFHVGGIWYYMFPSMFSGATTILQERFDPDQVLQAFMTWPITNIHLVPTMLSDLMSRPAFVRAARHLRLVVYAGSSMPSDLLARAMNTLENCTFAQAYGTTEAGSIAALSPQDHQKAITDQSEHHLLRSCGMPLSGTEVRIDRSANKSEFDPLGEILVRSEKLMAAYWRRPEATVKLFDRGWIRTGDIGYVDREGYLYIADRKNDMVVSGGENIFPFEVEEILSTHPLIEEVSVFGVPDPRWIEKLVAAVVLKRSAELTEIEMIEYARAHLPGYKTPKAFYIVKKLPKSAVGKVLRKVLREQFSV